MLLLTHVILTCTLSAGWSRFWPSWTPSLDLLCPLTPSGTWDIIGLNCPPSTSPGSASKHLLLKEKNGNPTFYILYRHVWCLTPISLNKHLNCAHCTFLRQGRSWRCCKPMEHSPFTSCGGYFSWTALNSVPCVITEWCPHWCLVQKEIIPKGLWKILLNVFYVKLKQPWRGDVWYILCILCLMLLWV